MRRNFETLIRRLDLGRFEDLPRFQIADDVSPLIVPVQRAAFACNIVSAAVAARINYSAVQAVSRPVRILHLRLGANAFCGVVSNASIIGNSAGITGLFADYWEYGTDLVAIPQSVAGSFPIIFDTAASILNANPFSFSTATVVEPKALPVLQPGQSLIFSPLTVATSVSVSVIWEEFREIDGSSNSP